MQEHHTDLSTYPKRIEHASIVEKVEIKMEKTRAASHPEKFETRAPNGHHKYIYINPFKLIKAPLLVWLFKLVRAPFFIFLFKLL